jgi:hypothetical protein
MTKDVGMGKEEQQEDAMKKIKLSEVWDQLPRPCQAWIKKCRLLDIRQTTEGLLNAEGLESYIEHWREHMERQKMTELYAELAEEMQMMEGEGSGATHLRAALGPIGAKG